MNTKPIPQSAQRDRVRKTVPALVEYTEGVVYGDLWERTDLSKRDRSLVTVAALVATYRPEQLSVHIGRALDNGVTQEEIAGLITHLAFYAGWPAAMSGAQVATEVFEKREG
ncbi:carboxymuconolactone decarboxylase family protein [Muricoccus aerilatus]|uniref:carboxymuconolactone decarboxylase family protein n=1 Tax=Muricoccus aerilatus TaxID=452982 RepID=UPI0005C1BF22|nr:carboxymuconolactone decarboxylase family protein [Roseomonas aerilata]